MKLLRNGRLIAEGRSEGGPGGREILFAVTRWHITADDDEVRMVPAPDGTDPRWRIEDGTNVRELDQVEGTRMGIGVDSGLRSLDIRCMDPNDDDSEVDLDVRDA